jgi:hypothetical protein
MHYEPVLACARNVVGSTVTSRILDRAKRGRDKCRRSLTMHGGRVEIARPRNFMQKMRRPHFRKDVSQYLQ